MAIAARLSSSYGWDDERATQTAEVVMDVLRKDFGGSRIYIPSRNGEAKERVRNEFNGRNIVELSRKYGVSAQTVRNYLKK